MNLFLQGRNLKKCFVNDKLTQMYGRLILPHHFEEEGRKIAQLPLNLQIQNEKSMGNKKRQELNICTSTVHIIKD